MKKLIFVLIFILLTQTLFGSHKVYIIHGYGGTTTMMKKLEKSVKAAHYLTENFAYKSLTIDLDSIGKQLYLNIKKSGIDTVSFVTHSMGGLVVRSMLQYAFNDKQFPVIYRIVMIAPPNGGAEIADFFSSKKGMKKLLGPNVELMRTDSNSYAHKLPKPTHSEVGIIIGIRGKSTGYNPFIPNDNDGLLTPKSARLGNEKDLVYLNEDHNILTQKNIVCKLVVEFLQTGFFISKK